MKITLLTIGKTTTRYLNEGIEMYLKRINRYISFEVKQLADLKGAGRMTHDQQKAGEGEMILRAIAPGDFVVLLDERGKQMTSRGFAEFIDRKIATTNRNIWFVVGGPYGFSQEVYDHADHLLSLSEMTFAHEMVRLFFVEQMYRAMTILHGEPYHHD